MFTMRKRGGESVSSGVFWNFKTGEKVRVQPGGQLPGAEKDIYFRVPRWVILSLLPVAGILMVDTLPNMMKAIYTQQTETLVFSYVVLVMGFLIAALGLVFAGVIWDLLSFRQLATFGWRPGEAYYSGTGKKKKDSKKEDQTEEQKK